MNIIIDDVMRLDSNGLLVYISRTKQNSAIKLRDFLKLIFMITNNKNDKKPRPQIKLRSYLNSSSITVLTSIMLSYHTWT